MSAERVTTADGRVLSDVEAAAHEGIVKRLSWASLHWGAEDLHPDALPHIAIAAIAAAAPLIEAQVRAQIAAREATLLAMFETVGEYGEALFAVPNRTAELIGGALVKAAKIARDLS